MSGRSCSLACAVFVARDLVAIEKPPECSIAHENPLLGKVLAKCLERKVWRGLKRRGDCGHVRFCPVRAVVAANRPGRAYSKATPRASTRNSGSNRGQDRSTKIHGSGSAISARLQSGRSLNQINAYLGIPLPFNRLGWRSNPGRLCCVSGRRPRSPRRE
jgi:hypothetical protein